jgi:hypothetical protein
MEIDLSCVTALVGIANARNADESDGVLLKPYITNEGYRGAMASPN